MTTTASLTNWFDALNRLTNRLDGLGQTQYRYAVLGNGQRTFTEDGPWASDEVTVTNRYGLRAGLRLAQPSGQFTVTNAWDAAGRWWVVGGTAGTFTYAYPAGSAGTLPISLTLPGGGYVTNAYDARCREIARETFFIAAEVQRQLAAAELKAAAAAIRSDRWCGSTAVHPCRRARQTPPSPRCFRVKKRGIASVTRWHVEVGPGQSIRQPCVPARCRPAQTPRWECRPR